MAHAYTDDELRVSPLPSLPTRERALGVAAFVFIALFVGLAVSRQTPPAAVSAGAPPAEFSSGRARRHLEVISRRPHPVGSTEHAAVRDYLLGELAGMGLSPELQTDSVVAQTGEHSFSGASVQNIAARLRGSDSTGAILLVGHYDTAQGSPGASDDSSAVAAILETLRALQTGPPLRNDVIALFTDAEEQGLLGARAFVGGHPWLKDVGLVLNFEARGSRGAVIMFETSRGNGWLVEEFAKAAPHPVANSLASDVYRLLPNDTDLTVFKGAGLPGLNFAYIDGHGHYHSALDTADGMDERSLQHQGSYALSLTKHFGGLSLTKAEKEDAIYFDVPGLGLFRYPRAWAVPLALAAAALGGAVIALGFRRRRLSVAGVALGAVALLVSLVSAPLLVSLSWWLISRLQGLLGGNSREALYDSNLYLLAFAALTTAVAAAVFLLFRRRLSVEDMAAGGLLWWMALTVLASFFLAGGSYLFLWPLLFSLPALAWVFARRPRRPISYGLFAVLCLCALPAVVLLSTMIYHSHLALGVGWSAAVMALLVLLTGLLIPHLGLMTATKRWLLPAAAAAAGVAFVVAANLSPGVDRESPKTDTVMYVMNADTGKAVWASYDAEPDEWTAQFFPGQTQRGDLNEFFPSRYNRFLKSPAPASALDAPSVTVLGDETSGDVRTVSLKITSPQEVLNVFVPVGEGQEVLDASVNDEGVGGEGAPARAGARWTLQYAAPPAEGVRLTLRVRAPQRQPLKMSIVGQSYGLPGELEGVVKPRPEHIIPAPFTNSDSTFVSRAYAF
jgi:hypothetical protein